MVKSRILVGVIFVAVIFGLVSCGKKKTAEPETSAGAAEGAVSEEKGGVSDLESYGKGDGSKLLRVYFDFDSSELSPDARNRLENNAEYLKKRPKVVVTIEGNCDERGTNQYNLALGERRAWAAKKYLMTLGISGKRLKTKSNGEEKPLVQGTGEEVWRQNRRADFVEK